MLSVNVFLGKKKITIYLWVEKNNIKNCFQDQRMVIFMKKSVLKN
jgi:hypothetical protein